MKLLALFLSVVSMMVSVAMLSHNDIPLDGKRFSITIVSSNDDNMKTPEELIFRGGKVDAPVCHLYGFQAASYQTVNNAGVISFSFTNDSEDEGTLYFTGMVNGEKICGTYLWKKEGREDLVYRFEGALN